MRLSGTAVRVVRPSRSRPEPSTARSQAIRTSYGVLAQQQQRIAFAGDAVELEHSANGTRNGLETL